MIKCLECGYEGNRLQWTHFKYKCTGRFKNGVEYMAAYPGAKVVDKELLKRSAMTLPNMIKKYGEVVGKERWDEYRRKQSESNSFEYKQKKHGWTKEQYDDYNKSRSSTLKSMIERHGEEVGTIKWTEYCERQSYTNTLEYYIETYGNELGVEKYDAMVKTKSHSIDAIMLRHNCSEVEATNIIGNYNRTTKYSSDLEVEFISKIEELLGSEVDYSAKSKQFCVYANKRANFFDLVHNNRAIEFNGDYWHCHPAQYEHNYFHKVMDMLAEDVWARDVAKIKALKSERNINTLVIWESDYKNNQTETLKRCIEWLTQKDN